MGHRYAILSSSSKVLHVHFSMITSLQRQYYHSLVIRILYAWKSHSEIVMAIGKKREGLLPSPYMLKLSGSTAFFCSKQSLTFHNMIIIQSGRLSLLQDNHLATGTPPVSPNANPRTQRAPSTLLPRKDFSPIG